MRISRTEPKWPADGVRSVLVTDGVTYYVDAPQAVTADQLQTVLLGSGREAAIARIEEMAEARSMALTSRFAGKRDRYFLKHRIALRAQGGDAAALALIGNEATKRSGLTSEALRDLIIARNDAWEIAAMKIETVEAEAKAAIAAALSEAAIQTAVSRAEAAFAAIV